MGTVKLLSFDATHKLRTGAIIGTFAEEIIQYCGEKLLTNKTSLNL